MKLFSRLVCFLVIIALLITLIASVEAATESLNVPAGEELVRKISVSTEDHVRIAFTVLSSSPSSMGFWIVFPNGDKQEYGEFTNNNITFVSDVKGECELHFDNTNSSSAQLVTLNYEVEHYYFGIAEIPFLMLVIVVLLLCAVAGYMIMGKYA